MKDVKDYLELASDPIWRINNLYSIVDKNANQIPFKPNVVQALINKSPKKRKIVLKARQFGVSTNEIIKLLDWVMHNENATACIIAHEQGAIEKLFRIVIRAYKFLPEEAKPVLDRGGGSRYEYYFPEINSRIYCDLEVRGDTIGRLHVSEAAFMKDSSRLKSTLQAVPLETGQVLIETTPNGLANYFYDMWTEQDSVYEKIFFPWYIFPEYKIETKPLIYTDNEVELIDKAKKHYNIIITPEQIAYRRFKKSEMRRSDYDIKRVTFEQEYPEDDQSCFLSSGESVLDLFAINSMIKNAKDPIRRVNGIKMFREKVKGYNYVIGADPAEGVGGDASAAVMICVETSEVVSVFNGQLKPRDFAYKLKEMADLYTNPSQYPPLIAVERNNHGHAVLLALDELIRYSHIFQDEDERMGHKTDGISRPLMVDRFVEAFENNHISIPDKEILSECLTLVNNNGKIEASSGKHDDLIIACCIAFRVKPDTTISYDNLESIIKL